nr:PREDICTED: solute carrier family 41 member 3-like isoform X2 [Bemisia tabaci]
MWADWSLQRLLCLLYGGKSGVMSVDKAGKKNGEKETNISHISVDAIRINMEKVAPSQEPDKKSPLKRKSEQLPVDFRSGYPFGKEQGNGAGTPDGGPTGGAALESASEKNYDTFTSSTNKFIVDANSRLPEEGHFSIAKQIAVPFLVSGFGMVGAGFYLNSFEKWEVFKAPGIPVLIPVLLGLKGNLEMTAASRLSTVFHVGISSYKDFFKIIVGNFSLVQGQALSVSLIAAHTAMFLLAITSDEVSTEILDHLIFLVASAMVSASLASIVLQFVTMNVMLLCRWLKINPDNVATQTVGSLGDLVSLVFFSSVSDFIFKSDNVVFNSLIITLTCLILIPCWFLLAYNIKYTRSVMSSGWVPLIVAMIITVCSGLVFSDMIQMYPGLAPLQPVLNGVGGSLVSVQASRLSSMLHTTCDIGTLPPNTRTFINPWTLFTSKEYYSTTVRVLLFAVIPGQLIFISIIGYIKAEKYTPLFILAYILIATLQVVLLLFICHILTHFLWSKNADPDLATIPYMTALGDLLGALFLGYTFEIFSMCRLQYRYDCPSRDMSHCY